METLFWIACELLVICITAVISYIIGKDKGYWEGRGDGLIDQHWYERAMEQRRKWKKVK